MTMCNTIMLYAVVTYANMRGIRAVDRILELCERNLAFIWLTQEILEDLHYQFLAENGYGEKYSLGKPRCSSSKGWTR